MQPTVKVRKFPLNAKSMRGFDRQKNGNRNGKRTKPSHRTYR